MDFVAVAEGLSGPFGYVALFFLVLVLSAALILPVPVFAVVLAAAQVLDPLPVGIIAGIASAIGELSGYFVGIGSEKVLEKKGKTDDLYRKAKELFEKYGFFGIVIATLFPLTLIDYVGVIAGVLNYGWKKFFLATLIGKIPRYIFVAYLGKEIFGFMLGLP
ncbi:MAG: VTT domain-containing protein [Candidatus Altiarchaeota archaeon]|nr:VTT domain-containing protein [Candidatus Altiarchaeota archaeon]